MNDYWAIPEKKYELSLFQFAKDELEKVGFSVMSEKLEVCSGAGAITITAIIKTKNGNFGLYIHDGPKQRKTRGPPIIMVLSLFPEMENAKDLRNFVITNQHDFSTILNIDNDKENIEPIFREIYSILYNSIIKDLYDNDLSTSADILKIRLRELPQDNPLNHPFINQNTT